jgi:hypothetical protein
VPTSALCLGEIWETLDVCYERPDEYIHVRGTPVHHNFCKYQAVDDAAVRDFCSLLTSTIMQAKSVRLFKK